MRTFIVLMSGFAAEHFHFLPNDTLRQAALLLAGLMAMVQDYKELHK